MHGFAEENYSKSGEAGKANKQLDEAFILVNRDRFEEHETKNGKCM